MSQLITFSPFHFIFQSKIIGIYVAWELRVGGAQYIATGRGLPTQRVPFLQLYQNFAQNVFYDGFRLLAATILVFLVGGAGNEGDTVSLFWFLLMLVMTIISWLYAPYIFNPYQFSFKYFRTDVKSLHEFFFADGGMKWKEWYEKTQLGMTKGIRVTINDILYWFFLIAAWYTTVGAKMHVYSTLIPNGEIWQILPVLPPVILSTIAATIGAFLEPCFGKQYGRDPRAARSFHMAYVAPVIAFLDVIEVVGTLFFVLLIDWRRTFAASLILKYFFLSLWLGIIESFLGLGWSGSYLESYMRLYLYGHRMAMDLLVSCFIFCTIQPMVAFDRIRHQMCKGCSLHNMIVFRNPGQAMFRAGDAVGVAEDAARDATRPLVDCEASPEALNGGDALDRSAHFSPVAGQDSFVQDDAPTQPNHPVLPPRPAYPPPTDDELLDQLAMEEELVASGVTAAMATAAQSGTPGATA